MPFCTLRDLHQPGSQKSILAEKSRDLESEFSQEIVAGAANTVEEVEIAVTQLRQALQTLPLFGGKKVIWFKEVNFLADSITGRAEGTRIQLENLQHTLEQINPENVDLVISAFPVDRRRSFLRWCEKNSDFHMTGGGRGADSDSAKFPVNVPGDSTPRPENHNR